MNTADIHHKSQMIANMAALNLELDLEIANNRIYALELELAALYKAFGIKDVISKNNLATYEPRDIQGGMGGKQ